MWARGRVDLSGDIICHDSDSGACMLYTWPGMMKVRVFSGLFVDDDTEHVSIYGALFMDGMGLPGFVVDKHSEVLYHKRLQLKDFYQVIELCSGMGIATQGFMVSGLTPQVANELQPGMAKAYSALHPDIPVVTGDVCDPITVIEIHRTYERSAIVAAGFSCQPYSAGGKCMGVHDSRSATLKGVLDAVKMLRSPVCILECVSKAGTNRYVRQVLDVFCKEFQFHLNEQVLRLEECWVTRRERWWAVLSAPCFGAVSIPPLPCIPFPAKVKHLLPQPMTCDAADLQELLLTEREMGLLVELVPNYKELYLPLNGKCPTCLHAWGSQFDGCPCGCRGPFAMETLRSRGVYGVFVPTGTEIELNGVVHPQLRHIHPTELAWLNGMIAPESWPISLKMSLAGLGQQACPIHSLWVGAQVVRHISMMQFGASDVSGSQLLDQHMKDVLLQIQLKTGALGHIGLLPKDRSLAAEAVVCPADACPVPVPQPVCPWSGFSHRGDASTVTLVDSASGAAALVRLSDPSFSLVDLKLAERALSSDAKGLSFRDCSTGQCLQDDDLVAGKCLWVFVAPTLAVASGSVATSLDSAQALTNEISPTIPWSAPAAAGSEGTDARDVDMEAKASVASESPVVAGMDEPLLKLHDGQFVGVLPPKVDSLRTAQALAQSSMPSEVRTQILQQQVGKWSDDEITWHALRILQESGRKDWTFMPVLLACECLRRNGVGLITQWLESLPSPPSVVLSVVAVDSHWVPFMWSWTASGLTASSWDIPGITPRCLNYLHDALSKAVGARSFYTHTEIRNFALTDFCGLCAVRWLDNRIRGRMLPSTTDEVHYLHDVARAQFLDFLVSQASVPRPWIWAAGLDVHSMRRLTDLLVRHGVPSPQTDSRTKLLVQALGSVEVQNAMTSGNPWRALKSLANQHKPPVKIVLQEELEGMIQSKGFARREGLKRKEGKGHGKGRLPQAQSLDPEKLYIDDGSFVASDQPLSHLPVHQIGPLAEGVVLTTVAQIEAHLKAGQLITNAGLGALVLNADDENLVTDLVWSQVRVVLRCRANHQPVLVSAHLVQLGRVYVEPARASPTFDMPEVRAACIKVAVYRDAIDCQWSEVTSGPIKFVLSVLAPLVVCQDCPVGSRGACVKWHPCDQSVVAEPVLDIWRRQWTSSTFKPCEPEVASIFWVNIRYLLDCQPAVLRCSGFRGVFVEPRSLDGKSGVDSHQVLWLPQEPLSELQRLQQSHVMIEGLARLGARHGLRVSIENAPALSRLVKPGTVYLTTGERSDFEVGPLPFGMDRLSMTKLCESWKWQARPLHPIRSLQGDLGTVWLLQSCHDPPAEVMKYKGGDIVINKVAKKLVQVGPIRETVGAADTMALCKLDASGVKVDPWLKDDPWQQASSRGGATLAAGAFVGNQLQQMESRIEKSLLTKLVPGDEDVEMPLSTPAVDARVVALEQQVSELVAKHNGLEVKLDESIQRGDAQISQFQSQVSAQFESQRGEMQTLFSHQMAQIEALLSKKARRE